MTTSYYRVMLGKASVHASECFEGGFIGADFDVRDDLTFRLPDLWKDFNREFVPIVMAADPEKTKIGAGLSCGSLWTVCKGIAKGDLVLSPDGAGTYRSVESSATTTTCLTATSRIAGRSSGSARRSSVP